MQAPAYLIADATEYIAQYAAWLHDNGKFQAALESRITVAEFLPRWLGHVIAYVSRTGLKGAPRELVRTTGERVLCSGVVNWHVHRPDNGQLLAGLRAGLAPNLGADQLVHNLRSGPGRLTRAELLAEVGEQLVERLETRPTITRSINAGTGDSVSLQAELAFHRTDGYRGTLFHTYAAGSAPYEATDGRHLQGLARADERYGVIWH